MVLPSYKARRKTVLHTTRDFRVTRHWSSNTNAFVHQRTVAESIYPLGSTATSNRIFHKLRHRTSSTAWRCTRTSQISTQFSSDFGIFFGIWTIFVDAHSIPAGAKSVSVRYNPFLPLASGRSRTADVRLVLAHTCGRIPNLRCWPSCRISAEASVRDAGCYKYKAAGTTASACLMNPNRLMVFTQGFVRIKHSECGGDWR
jgi:hypothetical protein